MISDIMESSCQELPEAVSINSTTDIVLARKKGRELAQMHGFSRGDQTRFATAISELTRNIITYADKGFCEFNVVFEPLHIKVVARLIDNGPGIDNPELAMSDGHSSGTGLGLGLPGAKRLVHELSISSAPGSTIIEISIKRRTST